MASYGTPLLNANNQSNEHIRANSIAHSTRTNPIRYAILLLFGIEKAEYGRKVIWVFRSLFQKARRCRAFFCANQSTFYKKNVLFVVFEQCSFIFGYSN
ncbi:MAG: hypothetical protein RL403_144 [Bacteroidota bacterium]